MVKRSRSGSGVFAAARSRCEGRNTGVRSPTIDANGLRSVMARVHADARGDAGLHHSLCHHDPRRAIRLGIPVSTVFQSYPHCGAVPDMAINNNIPVLRKCWVQPIIQYDLHISILSDVGGRVLSQENS